MKKYKITQTAFKTEKELRELANELVKKEGLESVFPNYTDKNADGGYLYDIDICLEFLEEFDFSLKKSGYKINNISILGH